MKKQIFIINGSGGVGKDKFVELVTNCSFELLGETKIKDARLYIQTTEIQNYSSVSKVKEIAKIIGWNGEKTEKDRKFLSDLKLLTTEYNDMPLNDMKKIANIFMNGNRNSCVNGELRPDRILFLHIREPEEIEKAVKAFEEYNAKTILVKRDSVEHITSNMADENVYNYNYDIVIENNGTLKELRNKAKQFLADFKNNTLKERY